MTTSKPNEPLVVAEPGTVSAGTMRSEDLIPAFTSALERLNANMVRRLQREYRQAYSLLNPDVIRSQADEEELSYLVDALFNALEEHAPEGHYFGAHEGDGADYGFWPLDDSDIPDDTPTII